MKIEKTMVQIPYKHPHQKRIGLLSALSLILTILFGCRGTIPVIDKYKLPAPVVEEHTMPTPIIEDHPAPIPIVEEHSQPPVEAIETTIPRMGYAIQLGAFSRLENAVRFTDSLHKLDLDPYYFKDDSGFYKVRFGNFPAKDLALITAGDLHKKHTIEEFYIVGSEDYSWEKENTPVATDDLRKGIVRTAKSFIGIPYRFGGETSEDGFDCSGLTMASYRLNGLDLPRASWQQWTVGRLIDKRDILAGDLVFFDTLGKDRVSHVGVYIGNGQFIHAPKTGKTIRIESMSNAYFKKRYLGARTYLDKGA